MKKILNRILAVNLFLIILPLLSSIVTNICVLIVSMLGENVTHIDGYSTMGIIIGGFFIYFPLWVIALVIYIIFIILILIFAVTALCVSENENKVNVIWTNSTVNILSYIMSNIVELLSGFFLNFTSIRFKFWHSLSTIFIQFAK